MLEINQGDSRVRISLLCLAVFATPRTGIRLFSSCRVTSSRGRRVLVVVIQQGEDLLMGVGGDAARAKEDTQALHAVWSVG